MLVKMIQWLEYQTVTLKIKVQFLFFTCFERWAKWLSRKIVNFIFFRLCKFESYSFNFFDFTCFINLISFFTQRHAFHLVNPSILPLLTSLSALTLTAGSVLFFHGFLGGFEFTLFGLTCVLTCMFLWWRDVVRESTLEGHHTGIVQLGLRYGMLLFIVSEIMFFLLFFEHSLLQH